MGMVIPPAAIVPRGRRPGNAKGCERREIEEIEGDRRHALQYSSKKPASRMVAVPKVWPWSSDVHLRGEFDLLRHGSNPGFFSQYGPPCLTEFLLRAMAFRLGDGNCLTPMVIKRSKTQAEEGLTPADEAGSVVLRQPPASKLANLFRIDVRDHALGLVTQQLGGRAREHPPGGSLLKQHPGRDSLAMKRRSCGWSEDFMLEVPTGATI